MLLSVPQVIAITSLPLKKLAQVANPDNTITIDALIHLLETDQQDGLETTIDAITRLTLMAHHIHQDPDICSGDPVIKGTRIRAVIIGTQARLDYEETKDSFPHLTKIAKNLLLSRRGCKAFAVCACVRCMLDGVTDFVSAIGFWGSCARLLCFDIGFDGIEWCPAARYDEI